MAQPIVISSINKRVLRAGDTMDGVLKGYPASYNTWINMSHNASFKIATAPATGYASSALSMKTASGAWSIGVYEENLRFVYGTDTNYNAGTNTVGNTAYIDSNGKLWGAVWNDYAEFRYGDAAAAGRCVIERGNDTLTLATERMQPGANIVSDTFGFSIGHNEESQETQLPIAVSGRVLAYGYEDRDKFRNYIGQCVCSGPNGTVSIMTRNEVISHPECIVGTISAVPDYEEWGTGNIKVDGRIWIKVK